MLILKSSKIIPDLISKYKQFPGLLQSMAILNLNSIPHITITSRHRDQLRYHIRICSSSEQFLRLLLIYQWIIRKTWSTLNDIQIMIHSIRSLIKGTIEQLEMLLYRHILHLHHSPCAQIEIVPQPPQTLQLTDNIHVSLMKMPLGQHLTDRQTLRLSGSGVIHHNLTSDTAEPQQFLDPPVI